MDSAFTNLDVKRDGPQPWTLTLAGTHMGYAEIILSNNNLYQNFCGLDYFLSNKKVLVDYEDVKANGVQLLLTHLENENQTEK